VAALLVGRTRGRLLDVGPVVCACRDVGPRASGTAVGAGAGDLDAVAAATGAACESCRPEVSP